jgi:hypothetical protein
MSNKVFVVASEEDFVVGVFSADILTRQELECFFPESSGYFILEEVVNHGLEDYI